MAKSKYSSLTANNLHITCKLHAIHLQKMCNKQFAKHSGFSLSPILSWSLPSASLFEQTCFLFSPLVAAIRNSLGSQLIIFLFYFDAFSKALSAALSVCIYVIHQQGIHLANSCDILRIFSN